ncbi:kinase-like protein [Lobosporangium transversale]|uniref:non-specific serine/threonine protein kinase n=1 Tax=Lobosporangium transversale TaxID=64571 RepID=A0A1Y2G7Z9_9FUNG|nr:kinase-like protein [Lobosporangium transversale]ORY98385.1 kinase-like protein [Lobosporangium transversale]|eukprot:XP_021875777.1 kinase-like protein [Lobosporangium transversale]
MDTNITEDFLDHYIDLFSYLKKRQERLQTLKRDLLRQKLSLKEYEQAWMEFQTQESVRLRQRRTRTQVIQFQILTQVGQGGFGEVFLARKIDTNELCALKRMSKRHLHLQDEVQHILTERDILTSTRSEWHVRLLYSFQDHQYVYLAMEFVQGGDLRTMLTARGVLREEDAKLYFAEMAMAIDALHQQGYIHRDLKPENFLIDCKGHLKLTDFGLSKGQLAESRIEAMKAELRKVKDSVEPMMPTLRRGASSMMLHDLHLQQQQQQQQEFKNEGIRRAYSIVGSADYMAPEILASKGYDFGVDYWSLGCILFEFLCGYSPFQAEDTRQTCVNVWHWRKVLQRPVYDTKENLEFNLSDEAWDLITCLIANRENRYTTVEQLKQHPWLEGLDWDNLRSMPASFVPVLATPMDTSYFDDFSNPDDMVGYKDVLLHQAQVQEAEQADAAATTILATAMRATSRHLPVILQTQDPWKRAFVGFTFRHHCNESR